MADVLLSVPVVPREVAGTMGWVRLLPRALNRSVLDQAADRICDSFTALMRPAQFSNSDSVIKIVAQSGAGIRVQNIHHAAILQRQSSGARESLSVRAPWRIRRH
jgi:hypothetical protein